MVLRVAISVFASGVLALFANDAVASCTCSCNDGRVQAICTSSFDIRPICPAVPCAPRIGASQVTPVGPPGTKGSCRDERVCDAFQRCEWKSSCR